MYYSRPLRGADLGFSLNPFHYVKAAAHDIVHPISTVKSAAKTVAHTVVHPLDTTKAIAHDVGHTAKFAADAVGHGIKVGLIKPFEWLAAKATAPIRNRVHKLRDRRAAKLAWDRHHTTTPDAKDKADAKSWTKSHLKHQGPHGEILALFAGPMPMLLGNTQLGDPATLSLITASIPVFMALMNSVLHKADASGQAPADPTRGAGGGAAAPGAPGAPGAGAAAGGDAGGGGPSAGGGDGGGDGGGGAKILGMPKKYVIIGGAVFGGVILLSLLTSSKKGSS